LLPIDQTSGMTAERSSPAHSSYATARWVFHRMLGVVYLFAFWSLAQQVRGLIGHDGILPAQEFMEMVARWADVRQIGVDRFRFVPTVCWFSTSDAFLEGLSVGGACLAALMAVGAAPILAAPALWVAYLSLVVVCQEFLSYQWDALLLEAGFLAILLAP